ncbi:MAG: hypothetical protein HYZ28_07105 [Myxococcales bacterium]|nr:hypothetical protein [Myxococcales bacterium]
MRFALVSKLMRRLLALVVVFAALGAIPAGTFASEAFAGSGRSAKKAAASKAAVKRAPSVKLKSAEQPVAETSAPPPSGAPPTRGPTRIDFDDRLIQGQTNRSGAVYLYDRKELKTRSMVKKRESFREEIVGSVYDG